MKKIYFDSHAHLNMEPLVSDSNLLKLIKQEDIYFNCIGTSTETSQKAINQAKEHKNIFAVIGIHPGDVNNVEIKQNINELEKLFLTNKKYIVAIGETGLDYHYDNHDKNKQKASFIEHIKLANKYNLSIVVHVRDAFEDAYDILKNYNKVSKVIIHCFTGTKQQAELWVKQNYYISFSGIITFKNIALIESLNVVPKNRILIETDCPFLAPVPFRGKTNTPLNIKIIGDFIANKLNIEKNEFAKIIFQNTIDAFCIKDIK